MRQAGNGVAVIVAAVSVTAAGALLVRADPPRPRGTSSSGQAGDDYRGYVVPLRRVELAAPIEEILRSVEVEESDRVTAGQVLAKMDDRLQEVVVEAALVRAGSTAEIDRAKYNVEDASLTLERISAAFGRNAANELEVRRAQIDVGGAQAAHAAALDNKALAEVNLRLEQRRLERYQIRAPFDGTVIEVLSDPGAMLNENENVLVLADLDTLEAEVNLPIALYGRLEVGGSYVLVADEPVNDELTWTLKTVNPIIDTASRTFLCVFSMDNREANLPAGFTVHLKWPQ